MTLTVAKQNHDELRNSTGLYNDSHQVAYKVTHAFY